MLNLNKRTKTKPKPKHSSLTTVHVCTYVIIVHNYRTQHGTEQFW